MEKSKSFLQKFLESSSIHGVNYLSASRSSKSEKFV